jgi:transcriptional regulator with XRE-family HTH domain
MAGVATAPIPPHESPRPALRLLSIRHPGETYSGLIRRLRDEMGWTQAEAGAHLGVSDKTLSLWERGRRVPAAKHRDTLSRRFGGLPSDYDNQVPPTAVIGRSCLIDWAEADPDKAVAWLCATVDGPPLTDAELRDLLAHNRHFAGTSLDRPPELVWAMEVGGHLMRRLILDRFSVHSTEVAMMYRQTVLWGRWRVENYGHDRVAPRRNHWLQAFARLVVELAAHEREEQADGCV